jgi:hypothetical protein
MMCQPLHRGGPEIRARAQANICARSVLTRPEPSASVCAACVRLLGN